MDIVKKDSNAFDATVATMKEQGPAGLHILADFDHTLTRSMLDNHTSGSVISQIRNGGYLSEAYREASQALYEQYYPMEQDASMPMRERLAAMEEWWAKHFALLFEHGLTRSVMQEVVAQRSVQFREGGQEFFDLLAQHNIPLVIMSAGLGDMIEMYLRQDNVLTPNVYIVSNRFEFEGDRVVGVRKPIIHSMNKHEVLLADQPFYSAVAERTNVILLGDSADDIGMVEGFAYNQLLSIGFPQPTSTPSAPFLEAFDATIPNDGALSPVTEIIHQIVG